MKNKITAILLGLCTTISLAGCSTAYIDNEQGLGKGTTSQSISDSSDNTPDSATDSSQPTVDYANLTPNKGFEYSEGTVDYKGELIRGYEAELVVSEPEDIVVVPSEYNGKPITDIWLDTDAKIGVLVIPDTIATLKYLLYDVEDYVENVWLDGNLYPYTTFAVLVNADLDPRDCDTNGFLISEDGKTLIRYAPALNQMGDSENITIPEGIEILDEYCFELAQDLESVQLPSTLVKIGDSAFYKSQLESITLPKGLKEIGNCAFEDSRLTSIILPEGLEKIGRSAFDSCDLTGSLVIPDSVTEIGSLAFAFNEFTTIVLGSGLSKIEDSFGFSDAIKSLTIPASVTEIGDYAFSGSAILESIVIEEGCTRIGYCAFRGSSCLTSVRLPETLRYLNIVSFEGCSSLSELTIPDNTRIVDSRSGSHHCDISEFNPELKIIYRGKVYPIQELEQLIADSEA